MINSKVSADGLYYQELRKPLLSLVRGAPKRVLEIGCASGQTLHYLRQQGAEYVVGMECFPDAAAAARARGVDEVIVADIEHLDWSFAPASFDLVIASHVLEHLTDPWAVLRKINRVLSPNGQLLGALPNVRHHSVMVPLLLRGRWEYQASGIMDWTHLRFFTVSTILGLLNSTGFRIDRIEPEFGRKCGIANRMTAGLFQGLLSFAYNFSAAPSSS